MLHASGSTLRKGWLGEVLPEVLPDGSPRVRNKKQPKTRGASKEETLLRFLAHFCVRKATLRNCLIDKKWTTNMAHVVLPGK